MHRHALILASLVLVTVAAGLAACQRADAGQHKAVLDKLDAMDRRLASIESRLAQGPARPQVARPQPPAGPVVVPVSDDDPAMGARHAKVTIVEAFEFACPHCRNASPVMDELVKLYPNDVRVVGKQFVVHPALATDAALGACAAGKQGKFGAYKHALFEKAWSAGGGMQREALARDAIVALANELGLDAGRFRADLEGDACKQMLARHREEVVAAGARGTPTFFVNGQLFRGPRTVEAFKAVIDAEIARADQAIRGGVKLEDYYAHLMKQAAAARP